MKRLLRFGASDGRAYYAETPLRAQNMIDSTPGVKFVYQELCYVDNHKFKREYIPTNDKRGVYRKAYRCSKCGTILTHEEFLIHNCEERINNG